MAGSEGGGGSHRLFGDGLVVDGQEFRLDEGETIHTENSYKYSIEEFQDLARCAGYRAPRVWTDPETLFSVHLLQPA